MDPQALAARILDEARALGFHRVGLTPVAPAARHRLYRDWLAAGRHGAMRYLAAPEHVDGRADPRALLDGARTLVAVALSYAHPDDTIPAAALTARDPAGPRGRIARYARGEDYHLVLKRKLAALADRLAGALGRPVAARPCVDTAPLLERDAAEAAGLGFVAKNTMLIAPGLGSYVLLGELLLDAEAALAPAAAAHAAEASRKRCGACRACLDACPTGAFVDAYSLDARRCISYLTIELEGAIPRELRPLVGDHVFGCDVCQEVCPFNAAAERPGGDRPAAPELAPHPRRTDPPLLELLALGAAQFRRLVRRSALRRIHRAQLLRNVCVALGNAGDPAAIAPLRRALATEASPLVREHAAWALARLGDLDGLRAHLAAGAESDPAVLAEIHHALAPSLTA